MQHETTTAYHGQTSSISHAADNLNPGRAGGCSRNTEHHQRRGPPRNQSVTLNAQPNRYAQTASGQLAILSWILMTGPNIHVNLTWQARDSHL